MKADRIKRYNYYMGNRSGLINILIITEEDKIKRGLATMFARSGFGYFVTVDIEQALEEIKEKNFDLIVADMNSNTGIYEVLEKISSVGMKKKPLVMVIIPEVMMNDVAGEVGVADFIIKPYDTNELFTRIQRLVKRIKSKDLKKIITSGDLVIDTVGCEVSLGGRQIELTFKEYELLRFLATSKGQVFTREILLNKVWKYDYLGGERTVDVHIRRLRSKIEDVDHTFIETVRNIGYRFRKDA